ncbi:MAG: hypothetical protein Q4C54_02275 [Clostridia bacterium]|nr:hypothetical protein [Clostridia bacterium]
MKRTMCLLLTVMLLLACASASAVTLRPDKSLIPPLDNGTFAVEIDTVDTLYSGGYIDTELFARYIYPVSDTVFLQVGDKVEVGDMVFTVDEVEAVEYPFRDLPLIMLLDKKLGGLTMWPNKESTGYCAVYNDYHYCIPVGKHRIMMPLPYAFKAMYGEEKHDAYDFERDIVELYQEYDGKYTRYNSEITFKNGLVVYVEHYAYPEGEEFGAD